jgi:segregation and condensation protein B
MTNDDTTKPPTPETHAGRSPSETGADTGTSPSDDNADGQGSDNSPSDEASSDSSTQSRVDRIRGAAEAMLLAADEPLTVGTIADAVADKMAGVTDARVRTALEQIRLDFSGSARGIHLEKVAGGMELRTNPEFHGMLESFVESSPISLSRASLETLAIVAYRQPITRADIEEIRGVNSQGVLSTLEEARLVHVVGQLDDLGQPHLYGTTNRFLELFGLDDLTELPTLSESERDALEELYDDELEAFDDEFE